MIDIAKLQGRVGTLEKALTGLGVLCLAALGWIFYNIYQPIKDLERDSAVQMEALEHIGTDIANINQNIEKMRNEPERSNSEKPAG